MINRIFKTWPSLAIAAVFVFFLGCQNQSTKIPNEDNSWTGANLRGKVKRVMEVTYRASNQGGTWIKGQQNQTYNVKTYSAEGFLLNERSYYSDSNQPNGGFDYIYDENNNLLKINVLDLQGAIASYSDIEERDGKVGIRKYTDYYATADSAIATGKTEMSWENHKLKGASSYDTQGKLLNTSSYIYDTNGDMTLFSVKNVGGNQRDLTVTYTYLEFDDQGNWLRQLKEYDIFPVKEITERQYEYFE